MAEERSVEAISQRVSKTVEQLVAEMASLEVDSNEKYQACEAWVRRNKETQKVVSDAFEAERVEKKAAYDAVLEAKGKFIRPLEAAEKAVRSRMVAWSTEQEKRRREEAAHIEAEKKAERSEDVLLEAETLEAMGRQDDADALLERGARVTKAEVARAATVEKVGKTMEKWVVTVVDADAFFEALPGMGQLQECVEINASRLALLFKKNGTKSFPGLKVEQTFVPVI